MSFRLDLGLNPVFSVVVIGKGWNAKPARDITTTEHTSEVNVRRLFAMVQIVLTRYMYTHMYDLRYAELACNSFEYSCAMESKPLSAVSSW